MAANLIRKGGLPVYGADIVPAQIERFEQAGGLACADATEVISRTDLVFLCLPNNTLVKKNMEIYLANGRNDSLLVDLSSAFPDMIRAFEPNVRKAGLRVMDCPVSGGEVGAMDGTLVLMAGGDAHDFEEVLPYLMMIGSKATYMGAIGAGYTAKLANNMIVGCTLGVIAEAMAFATKAGLDPKRLFEAIKDGAAGSPVLALKAPKTYERDFTASARLSIHQKDLKNALDVAATMDITIPLSQHMSVIMDKVSEMGFGDEDGCAVVKYFEREMGVTVKASE
jgi:2-hydroxy-3-oxopropionate reductase